MTGLVADVRHPHSSDSVQRVSRFGFAERVVAASRDCLRLGCLSLTVGREHRGGMVPDEVLPLLWGEIATRATSRRAFRTPC